MDKEGEYNKRRCECNGDFDSNGQGECNSSLFEMQALFQIIRATCSVLHQWQSIHAPPPPSQWCFLPRLLPGKELSIYIDLGLGMITFLQPSTLHQVPPYPRLS